MSEIRERVSNKLYGRENASSRFTDDQFLADRTPIQRMACAQGIVLQSRRLDEWECASLFLQIGRPGSSICSSTHAAAFTPHVSRATRAFRAALRRCRVLRHPGRRSSLLVAKD